jgi:hypothetical protein
LSPCGSGWIFLLGMMWWRTCSRGYSHLKIHQKSLPRGKLCRFGCGKCALAACKAQGKFQALAYVSPLRAQRLQIPTFRPLRNGSNSKCSCHSFFFFTAYCNHRDQSFSRYLISRLTKGMTQVEF